MLASRAMGIVASALALALATSACSANAPGQMSASANDTEKPTPATSQYGLTLLPLTVATEQGQQKFSVELAQTIDQQARGLMFRTELGADEGMIFPFPTPKPASFWMKNTVIPLDIIFIREDGTIESIAANTTPYSLDPVSSGEPVAAVLELRGGRAAELGIEPGAKVQWTMPQSRPANG